MSKIIIPDLHNDAVRLEMQEMHEMDGGTLVAASIGRDGGMNGVHLAAVHLLDLRDWIEALPMVQQYVAKYGWRK